MERTTPDISSARSLTTSGACSAAASRSSGSATRGTTRGTFRSRVGLTSRGSTSSSARSADTSARMPRDPMPQHVVPMLARLSTLPAERDDDKYGYEIKWDGVRAVAYVTKKGATHLESRNLNDVTRQYPEAAAVGQALTGHAAVLDGEVVAFDEHGRPSFERLQGRIHLTGAAAIGARTRSTPIVYVVFDLLYLDGESLLRLPYTERRARLEELDLNGRSWRTPAYHAGEGAALLDATATQGLEGVMAKRLDS